MSNSTRLVASLCLAVLILFSAEPSAAGARWQAVARSVANPDGLRISAVLPHTARRFGLEAPPVAGSPLILVADGRPSAAAIDNARRRGGLPASARAVGWRLVESRGRKFWKIIFRVGNRQVAVEVPAGR